MHNRVLVLGDDMGVFLAVARSLGRRGIEVHVAPADANAPGLSSRYISQLHPLPPYHADPAQWTHTLKVLIDRHGYRLIIPCDDSRMLILRHHARELGRSVLALANEEALAIFTDKAATRNAAARAGIPVARGVILTGAMEGAALAKALGLPLVVKPAVPYTIGASREKVMARIIRNPAQFTLPFPSSDGRTWIAESYVPGEGIGLSILARNGEVLIAFQHRRLEVVSETGGSTARVAEAPDPRLLEDARALVRETRLNGVAMFEFRRDRASGRYALLEVNPRFWGSLPLAVAARADFPALLWDMLTQSAPPRVSVPLVMLKKCSMAGELDRLAALRSTGSVVGRVRVAVALLHLLVKMRRGELFDSWAADDERPFLIERHQVLQRLAGWMWTFVRR